VIPSYVPDAASARRSAAGGARVARRQLARLRAGAALNLFAARAAAPMDGSVSEAAPVAVFDNEALAGAATRPAPRARRAVRSAAGTRLVARFAGTQGRSGRRRPPAPRPRGCGGRA
jgi:hypothetical protein